MAGQTELVIDLILARIDAGTALPGDRVEEKEIMQACDVSRTPVREALIRLEADGLIERHPRKGAVIFRPSVASFLTILEVHANLESFAAGLAAQRITPELKEELQANVAACTDHATAYGNARSAQYYTLNLQFHEIIARAAHNDMLMQMIKTNARKIMAYYRVRYQQVSASQSSAAQHAQIADHIMSHRAPDAARAMQEHFNYDRQTVMDLIASID